MSKTDQFSNKLVVVLNSSKELEYFRDRSLSEKQRADVEKFDAMLDQGFEVHGQKIDHPSMQDKATFAANLLVTALLQDNNTRAAILCSYLATRYPALQQVRVTTHDDRVTIELIYDKAFMEESSVQFISKKELY